MIRWLAILAALTVAHAAGAEAPEGSLGVGDALPTLELEDQHGETATLDASAQLVLFSRDMDGGPTAAFPARSGHATLLFVDAGQIARVEFVASPAALRAAVEPEPED